MQHEVFLSELNFGLKLYIICKHTHAKEFPSGSEVKNPLTIFDPWVGKIPWRRKWQPTPVFLPGKSCGQRSLAGYSLQGNTELDMTEQVNIAQHMQIYT